MSSSCLVAKLGHFAPLSEHDQDLLRALEKDEEPHRRDEILRRAGDPVDTLFVVSSGWLTSFSTTEDGRRQLLKLFYPGDIVDLAEAGRARAAHTVRCITDVRVCPFPKAGLEPIFARSPRLTALLFAMTVRETGALLDRIRAIGRFSAYERLCYLLLEVRDRLSVLDAEAERTFHLPLTQMEIADLVGLTNVYVSKTFSRLEKDGLIRRRGSVVTLVEPERMAELCEYRGAEEFDPTWFPEG